MSNVVREIKVVMNFELEEMFLKQTKYKKDEIEQLVIDLLEGRYKEYIFVDDDEIPSPIFNVCIGSIEDED
jgi:hypothetical protein